MAEPRTDTSGDLVLAPGQYIYMQDIGKGSIKVCTGPTVVNASGQQRPVTYDQKKGRFVAVVRLEEAVQQSPIAVEGYYLVLRNPAEADRQPMTGNAELPPELIVGRKVNIPGPTMFALWPGQACDIVKGHHLRYNQYLFVRVYNEEEARKNWTRAVVKPANTEKPANTDDIKPIEGAEDMPEDLTVGRMLVIRGDQVSFYMPPTGISVTMSDQGSYVRDALTLERLEYCVLVDEDGNKRYEIGPQVVFPAPTEHFRYRNDDHGNIYTKFRAIELNELQGLHLKVIAPYIDENGTAHKLGEELFITGKTTAIFYPREELSTIRYDGKNKHFATAIPAGEARYVMNRMTGEIRTVHGPQMLLPDPRYEVIVRRPLSDKQVQCWYPGNVEALTYNQMLRDIVAKAPTVRQGVVSEGDFFRNASREKISETSRTPAKGAVYSTAYAGEAMDRSLVSYADQDMVGDEFSRASSYTEPRTLMLQTKYEGVPAIDVWTGYAVKVVSKTGKRRVEVGPQTILPDYDESLEVMELSTGKPKTTNQLLKTAYLRVTNNKISDIVEVETKDLVTFNLKLSYRVNFEGSPEKWFDVENYVKFLCDHVRSVLKGAVKRATIEDFYENATDFIRDVVLGTVEEGKARPGMVFQENGMRILDIEVLKIQIMDEHVAQLLGRAQHDVVAGNIMLDKDRRELALLLQREQIARERRAAEHITREQNWSLESVEIGQQLQVNLDKTAATLKEQQDKLTVVEAEEHIEDLRIGAVLDRRRASTELDINLKKSNLDLDEQFLKAETEAAIARFGAAQPHFTEALLALRDSETLKHVAEAWSMNRVVGGASLSDALGKVFERTPLNGIVQRITGNNGDASHTVEPPKPVTTRPRSST